MRSIWGRIWLSSTGFSLLLILMHSGWTRSTKRTSWDWFGQGAIPAFGAACTNPNFEVGQTPAPGRSRASAFRAGFRPKYSVAMAMAHTSPAQHTVDGQNHTGIATDAGFCPSMVAC